MELSISKCGKGWKEMRGSGKQREGKEKSGNEWYLSLRSEKKWNGVGMSRKEWKWEPKFTHGKNK